MSLNDNVSVVLPTYNESENIEELIIRIEQTLKKNLFEIIIVDDDSIDGTREIIKNLKRNKIKLVHRKNKKGLASALADGVNLCKGNIIVWMDSDLGFPPEEINNLLIHLESYDIVVGSRYVKNGKDKRKQWITIHSLLINYLAQLVLDSRFKDYTSGFIALKKEVISNVKINPEGFGEYFIEFIYKALKNNYLIKEVGYVFSERKGGASKASTNLLTYYKLGFSYILKIFKLKFNMES